MPRIHWLLALPALLTGCVSLNVDTAPIASALPGLVSQFATPQPSGTYGPPAGAAPGATGVCLNGATPASGVITGAWVLGDYNGVALPGSFGVYQAEQDVTDRITAFSRDTSANGAATWENFQCLFPAAVAVWRAKEAQAPGAVAPTPMPFFTPTPMPFFTPTPAPVTQTASGQDCPSVIDPANGTTTGTAAQGAYEGALLPGSFAVYQSEEDITDRIAQFAADESDTGRNTWVRFQCFYAQAVGVWRSRQAYKTLRFTSI